MSTDELKLKTVAVLGGSYGGNRAAQVLAAGLPSGWRVVLVDRNSHFNHVYNLPRYTVLPGHEHKAFIPYDNLFNTPSKPLSPHPHKRVHGTITSLHPNHVTYTPHARSGVTASIPSESPALETTEEEILFFEYAVYALGSHLPPPINLWDSRDSDILSFEAQELVCSDLQGGPQSTNHIRPYMGTKREGVSWARSCQRRIEAARQVLVVGGGALGIQFASDIAAVYPRKSVTLLHSRSRLLPRFDEALGDEACQGLQELGVQVIFGERLDMSSRNETVTKGDENHELLLIKTTKGREIEADLVLLCTGQMPNTSLLHAMDPRTIDTKTGMVRVSCTMQILAFGEQVVTSDEGNRSDVVCSTSPTEFGAPPPSPVDMLVEPGSTNEIFDDASCNPHTFVYPRLFAIGDAADAFGAIKAGHTAYYQGEVAARNVIRLIKSAEKIKGDSPGPEGDEDLELEEYVPGPLMIKVSLGLTRSAYEVAGVVGTKDDGTDDLGVAIMWGAYGYSDIDEEGMWM